MGDMDGAGATWRGFLCLLLVLAAIGIAGWLYGGGSDPAPVKVQLTCTQQGDQYDCETR